MVGRLGGLSIDALATRMSRAFVSRVTCVRIRATIHQMIPACAQGWRRLLVRELAELYEVLALRYEPRCLFRYAVGASWQRRSLEGEAAEEGRKRPHPTGGNRGIANEMPRMLERSASEDDRQARMERAWS